MLYSALCRLQSLAEITCMGLVHVWNFLSFTRPCQCENPTNRNLRPSIGRHAHDREPGRAVMAKWNGDVLRRFTRRAQGDDRLVKVHSLTSGI